MIRIPWCAFSKNFSCLGERLFRSREYYSLVWQVRVSFVNYLFVPYYTLFYSSLFYLTPYFIPPWISKRWINAVSICWECIYQKKIIKARKSNKHQFIRCVPHISFINIYKNFFLPFQPPRVLQNPLRDFQCFLASASLVTYTYVMIFFRDCLSMYKYVIFKSISC